MPPNRPGKNDDDLDDYAAGKDQKISGDSAQSGPDPMEIGSRAPTWADVAMPGTVPHSKSRIAPGYTRNMQRDFPGYGPHPKVDLRTPGSTRPASRSSLLRWLAAAGFVVGAGYLGINYFSGRVSREPPLQTMPDASSSGSTAPDGGTAPRRPVATMPSAPPSAAPAPTSGTTHTCKLGRRKTFRGGQMQGEVTADCTGTPGKEQVTIVSPEGCTWDAAFNLTGCPEIEIRLEDGSKVARIKAPTFPSTVEAEFKAE